MEGALVACQFWTLHQKVWIYPACFPGHLTWPRITKEPIPESLPNTTEQDGIWPTVCAATRDFDTKGWSQKGLLYGKFNVESSSLEMVPFSRFFLLCNFHRSPYALSLRKQHVSLILLFFSNPLCLNPSKLLKSHESKCNSKQPQQTKSTYRDVFAYDLFFNAYKYSNSFSSYFF